jgi:hypothetical protein
MYKTQINSLNVECPFKAWYRQEMFTIIFVEKVSRLADLE